MGRRAASRAIPAVPHSVAMYGDFFVPEDWPALAKATGLDVVPESDLTALAGELDEAATTWALGTIAAGQATWGERADWAEAVDAASHHVLGLLAPDEKLDADHVDPICRLLNAAAHPEIPQWAEAVNAVARQFRGFCTPEPDPDADHAYALSRLLTAGVHPAEWLTEAQAQTLLELLARVASASRSAAAYARRRKGTRVVSPDRETWFYGRLGCIYSRAFGRAWTISTSGTGRRTGPAIHFCHAVGDRIALRAPWGGGGPGDALLRQGIDRLRDGDRAAERIRDSRTWENRLRKRE